MTDTQLLRVSWWYGSLGPFGDGGSGEWYFRIPQDWDVPRFHQELEARVKHHLKTEGWPYEFTMNWGDLVTEVDLGPEITLLDRPIADLEITVNHDDSVLPPFWDAESSCPDCFGTGEEHEKIGELDYRIKEPKAPCPSCNGTGLVPEEDA